MRNCFGRWKILAAKNCQKCNQKVAGIHKHAAEQFFVGIVTAEDGVPFGFEGCGEESEEEEVDGGADEEF